MHDVLIFIFCLGCRGWNLSLKETNRTLYCYPHIRRDPRMVRFRQHPQSSFLPTSLYNSIFRVLALLMSIYPCGGGFGCWCNMRCPISSPSLRSLIFVWRNSNGDGPEVFSGHPHGHPQSSFSHSEDSTLPPVPYEYCHVTNMPDVPDPIILKLVPFLV